MIRSIIATCAIVLGGFIIYSNYETTTNLVGEVFMEEGETAPFAEIKIYSADNNQLVKTESADEDGNFSLADLQPGDYVLEVSYVGYKDYKAPLAICSDKETNTGSIELEPKFNDAEFAARPNTASLSRS